MNQIDWLKQKKAEMAENLGVRLTWDEFASNVEVEPRALKNYRLPENSANYRNLPRSTRSLIEIRVSMSKKEEEEDNPAHSAKGHPNKTESAVVLFGLGRFVSRQAAIALQQGVPITGISQLFGREAGILPEERKTLALLSKMALKERREDIFSEIHEVLWLCTQHCSQWLPIPELEMFGLQNATLLDPETLTPTSECVELSERGGDATSLFEEALFREFLATLEGLPRDKAHRTYTNARSFVIRHPLARPEDFSFASTGIDSRTLSFIYDHFYESYSSKQIGAHTLNVCSHCGSPVYSESFGKECSLKSCRLSNRLDYTPVNLSEADDLRRASRGIRRFWIEPGLDEIKLYDALIENGVPEVELFPERDLTDVSVGGYEIGIDLKAHTSAEILGFSLKNSIKGLANYKTKIICVPDYLVNNDPDYLSRLEEAAERENIHFKTVSQTIKFVIKNVKRAGA